MTSEHWTSSTSSNGQGPQPGQRKVLLPVDQSENSGRAVEWYFKYARLPDDYVILYHSVDTSAIIPSTGYMWAGPLPMSSMEKMLKEKEKEVKDLKLKYVNILYNEGVTGEFMYSSLFSHPGEAIVEACKQNSVDYVVMGNRGMGAIRRTFMGSISDYVLHHAHIPVTIIPPVKQEKGHSHHHEESAQEKQ